MTLVEFLFARLYEDGPTAAYGPLQMRLLRAVFGLHQDIEIGGRQLCRGCADLFTNAGSARLAEAPTHPCDTIRALAVNFASHPGYDEAWRPSSAS